MRAHYAAVPPQRPGPGDALQFEHLNRLSATVIHDIEPPRTILQFRERFAVRYKRVADRSRAGRIAPGLVRLIDDRHLAERLFSKIEQRHPRARSALAALIQKLSGDEVLAVRRKLQIFRLSCSAQNFDIAMSATSSQRRRCRLLRHQARGKEECD